MSDAITIRHGAPFIKQGLDPDVSSFLTKSLISLTDELNHLSNTIYNYPGEYVFDCIEQTWIGMLNNAIIKTFPGVGTLQEFSVMKRPKEYGRADYFVRVKQGGRFIDFLFEAKAVPEKGTKFNVETLNRWYDQLLNKAFEYYKPVEERKYYSPKTFIVAIIFGWIRTQNHLTKTQIKMDEFLKSQNGEETDFCALYHGAEKGAWVYGRVKPATMFPGDDNENL